MIVSTRILRPVGELVVNEVHRLGRVDLTCLLAVATQTGLHAALSAQLWIRIKRATIHI